MESAMITAPQANGGISPAASPAMAGVQQGTQGAGGFAAILDLMLAGTQGGELSQLFANLAQADESLRKEGGELAAQMLAELFAAGDFLPVDLLPVDAMGQNGLSALDPAQLQQQNLAWMLQNQSALHQPVDETAQLPEMLSPLQNFLGNQQAGPANDMKASLQSASLLTEDGNQGEMQFLNAVSEAKEQLGQGTDSSKEQPQKVKLDIEQLQQEVDTGKYRTAFEEIRLSAAAKTEETALADQVKTGILHNLRLGKNEFVVKLKPEGLGEITVKLVESGSKLALSIVASNAETARLLNNGLDGLRESLRPYHAEISEVVQQQQYASQQQSFEQNFAGQHQQQQHHSGVTFWDGPGDDPAVLEEEAEALLSELDTYI